MSTYKDRTEDFHHQRFVLEYGDPLVADCLDLEGSESQYKERFERIVDAVHLLRYCPLRLAHDEQSKQVRVGRYDREFVRSCCACLLFWAQRWSRMLEEVRGLRWSVRSTHPKMVRGNYLPNIDVGKSASGSLAKES